MPSDADVLATVRLEEDPLRVHFSFASGAPAVFDFNRGSVIEDAWRRASSALKDLVDATKRGVRNAGLLAEPLRALTSAGTDLGQRLCNNKGHEFNRIQNSFAQSRRLGWPRFDRDRIPVVQLIAREASYPLELLPVFLEPGEQRYEIGNDAELLRVAERFLGFTAAVRRLAPDSGLHPVRLDNEPTLPIQLMRYQTDKPSGFDEEGKWLRRLSLLSVDGPWPTDQSPPM